MDMIGASILFSRGANTHNQLSQVVREAKGNRFISLLEEMDVIYALSNIRENREKLQNFIITYGLENFLNFILILVID